MDWNGNVPSDCFSHTKQCVVFVGKIFTDTHLRLICKKKSPVTTILTNITKYLQFQTHIKSFYVTTLLSIGSFGTLTERNVYAWLLPTVSLYASHG